MFYDALIDLKVDKAKAKAMYFAVYWKGPRWEKFAAAQACIGPFKGECKMNKAQTITVMRSVKARYSDNGFDKKFLEVQNIINKNPEISLEALEKKADSLGINPLLSPKDTSFTISNEVNRI